MSETLEYNIGVQEQSDWTETVIYPVNTEMSGMVATGDTSTVHYTGRPAELRTLRNSLLSSGSKTAQKTAVLRGLDGGMADLVVTTAAFVTQDSLEPTPGGGEEGGTAGEAMLGTEYTYDVTAESVSILNHPKIKDYTGTDLAVLQMVANGANPAEVIEVTSTEGVKSQITLGRYIEVANIQDAVEFVRKTPQYSVPVIKCTASRKMPKTATIDLLTDLFKPIEGGGGGGASGPGNPPKIQGRDWLYLGGGSRTQGNQVVITKTWLLSNPGGWDKEIYAAE